MRHESSLSACPGERDPLSLGSPPISIHCQQHPLRTDTPHHHSFLQVYLQKHQSFILFTGIAWTYSWMMAVEGWCCLILLLMVSTSHPEPGGTNMAQ